MKTINAQTIINEVMQAHAAPTPTVAAFTPTPTVAISTDEKRKQWQGFAQDIPASLAINAFHGVSMSPERRGASAQNEYGQTMAADYEKMRAQAVKGGTLDLLPEVFARYRARQAGAYRAYLASSSRCVSSFIAGSSNFPAARMNKRNDIAHKRLNEYLDGGKMAMQAACRTLRPDLRAIMAGDVDAIDRLTVKIDNAERAQNQMKAANKAIRANAKLGEAHQVSALLEIGFSERQARDVIKPDYCGRVGFASYELTNNNANIRRMRERLESISKAQACEVVAVECASGITLEDDAPANRVRLFFLGKPSEEIRTELKSAGFRWAPSVGAWQAYRNSRTLETARRMAGEVVKAAPAKKDAYAEYEEASPAPVAVAEIEDTPPVVESTEAQAPTVAEFLPVYALPAGSVYKDWERCACDDFTPDARQALVIDAMTTALSEGLFYTSEVLARCIVLLNIDAATQAIKTKNVEGGDVGMDCYYARRYIDSRKAREQAAQIKDDINLKVGDELGILVFTDYKRTTGVKITEISPSGSVFTFAGKRGAHTVQGSGSAEQLKNAIDRAFTAGKRKTDYPAFVASRPAPTPPAMESQPDTPSAEFLAEREAGEALVTAALDRLMPETRQDAPAVEAQDSEQKQPLAPVDAAQVAINNVAQRYTFRPGVQDQKIVGKSGKWMAALRMTSAGLFELGFKIGSGCSWATTYATARERMAALQALARAADAPDDTPPDGGGLPPAPSVAVSSATTPVAVRRNIVPDNGTRHTEDAFEAWTFTSGARFAFVMYLGKSAKPWKYYGYPTEAKRDDGFQRHAVEAREILAHKATRKAQADKPHGLQVGDVVRSSWGYDQTNIDHYQIVKLIGKRTVEVRKLAEHIEATGDMSGDASPIWGEFVGEVMRRSVDSRGNVNILRESFGRASKIEPLTVVHGVRCYAASAYSSYA